MRHARPAALASLAAAALLLAACGEGEGEGDINMRPGANCLASGCHAGGEHRFAAGGTVFESGAGGAGVGGVMVRLLSGATVLAQTVTASSGNFRVEGASLGTFDVELSKGGATRTMFGASGACNDCHASVGGTGRIPAP